MILSKNRMIFLFQVGLFVLLLTLIAGNIDRTHNLNAIHDFEEQGFTFGPTTLPPVHVKGIPFSNYKILTIHSSDLPRMDRFSVRLPLRIRSFEGVHVRLTGTPYSVDLTVFPDDFPRWRRWKTLEIAVERYPDRAELKYKDRVLAQADLSGHSFTNVIVEDRNSDMSLLSFDLFNENRQKIMHLPFAAPFFDPVRRLLFILGALVIFFWIRRSALVSTPERFFGQIAGIALAFLAGTFFPIQFPLKTLLQILLFVTLSPVLIDRFSGIRERQKQWLGLALIFCAFASCGILAFRSFGPTGVAAIVVPVALFLVLLSYLFSHAGDGTMRKSSVAFLSSSLPAATLLPFLLFKPDAGAIPGQALLPVSVCMLGITVFSHRKVIKGAASLLFVIVVLAAGVAEWALRNSLLDSRLRPMNIGKSHFEHDDLLFAPGELFQTQDHFKIGALRFRDKDADVAKPDRTYRIITMGGSNCYGDGLDRNDQTFSAFIEGCLNQKIDSVTVEVLNGGVKGFNLFQLSKLFEHYALDYHPDMLILYININDSVIDLGPFTYQELWQMKQAGRWQEVENLLARNSSDPLSNSWVHPIQQMLHPCRLYNLLTIKITKVRSRQLRPIAERFDIITDVNPPEDYQKNLNRVIQLCRDHQIALILADAFAVDYSYEAKGKSSIVREIMKEEAAKNQVPFVPINDLFHSRPDKRSLVFSHDTIHLNREGHRLVGETLCKFIEEGRYLPGRIAR